jgi:hypothetical protein
VVFVFDRRLPSLSEKPKPQGLGTSLATATYVELAQHRRDVMIDRLLGHDQSLRDLRVA